VSIDLGRRLIATGLVPPEEVEAALFVSMARGVPFPRVLLDRGTLTERALEQELDHAGSVRLHQVNGAVEIVRRLPRAMCRRLAALPTSVDPATGTVDVAAADPLDAHVAAEFGFHLGAPIRVLRAPIAAVEDAIRRLELGEVDAPTHSRTRRMTPPFPHGAPQSTVPPPPQLDAAPIPLLRRAPPAAGDAVAIGDAPPRSGGTLVPPSGAPPLASGSLSAPRPMPVIPPPADYEVPRSAASRRPADEQARDKAARASILAAPEAPSVSFPSMPPDGGDRHASTHGARTPDTPHEPETTYRIAPRVEHVVSLRDARKRLDAGPPALEDEAPSSLASPASLRTTLGWGDRASSGRGLSRPTMAAVPYPAAPLSSERPAVKRVRAPDGAPVLEALGRAASRDDVIRITMRGMRLVARRIAIFVVRRDGFHGWACNVDFGDLETLRAIHVPPDGPSLLATATVTAMYLGPIAPTPAHEGLLRAMERASADVAAIAVRVAGRAVLVLVCDDLEDTMTSTRYLGELARAAGDALTRLLGR
jgi:hypothetical protein